MTAVDQLPQVTGGTAQSAFDGSRLRVVLLLELHPGAQQRFLDAYRRLSGRVAATDGHLRDQLCQSVEDPAQWLLTSEWADAPRFLAWVNSEEHLALVGPLRGCVRSMRSLRYGIVTETVSPAATAAGAAPAPAVRVGDGVVRHALGYALAPGHAARAAAVLAGYPALPDRPGAPVRVVRSTLWRHGSQVVHTLELRLTGGDVLGGLLYLAGREEVRAWEAALAPHLARPRRLGQEQAARVFFTRAALPAVHHHTTAPPPPDAAAGAGAGAGSPAVEVGRCALYLPARPGQGEALARLLADPAQPAAGGAGAGCRVRAVTVFHRQDTVVRLVETDGPPQAAPGAVTGLGTEAAAAAAGALLDGPALGVDGPLGGERALARLLTAAAMQPLADYHPACQP